MNRSLMEGPYSFFFFFVSPIPSIASGILKVFKSNRNISIIQFENPVYPRYRLGAGFAVMSKPTGHSALGNPEFSLSNWYLVNFSR